MANATACTLNHITSTKKHTQPQLQPALTTMDGRASIKSCLFCSCWHHNHRSPTMHKRRFSKHDGRGRRPTITPAQKKHTATTAARSNDNGWSCKHQKPFFFFSCWRPAQSSTSSKARCVFLKTRDRRATKLPQQAAPQHIPNAGMQSRLFKNDCWVAFT